MRRQKPLPKESSFKEFSKNRANKPKCKTRTKKPRFQIKDLDEKKGSSNSRKSSTD